MIFNNFLKFLLLIKVNTHEVAKNIYEFVYNTELKT